MIFQNRDKLDNQVKDSPFYIRQKLEIGLMADDFVPRWAKFVIIFLMIVYMYGAMILKYVAGSESLVKGVSVTLFGHEKSLEHKIGFDPYYIGVILFATFSIYFSFGNIENAKTLQIVTTILRFFTTFLMILGSIISLFVKGGGITTPEKFFTFSVKDLDGLFGGTIFIFI